MAGRGSKSSRAQRENAERARLHTARQEWHERGIARRVRDNTVAGIAGGVIVIAAIASQSVHAAVTAPEPSSTQTPAPVQNPFENDLPAPAPSGTPATNPTPSATPVATTSPTPAPAATTPASSPSPSPAPTTK